MSRRVVIAATFALEPVLSPLSYWLDRRGLEVAVEQAPYGQVLEQVASEAGRLAAPETDLGVVLVRIEDLLREEGGELRQRPEEVEAGDRHVAELAGALRDHAAADGCPILIGAMPATGPAAVRAFVARGRRTLAECAESHSALSWLDIDGALALYSVREVADPFRDEIAHIPFTEECLTAVGTTIARQLRALWGPPCKAIALDCDNTLWRGACSEDPLEELDAGGPFEYLRAFMREQARSGRLLCLVSRNPEADVARAFSRHGAPLTAEHVVARRCGWDAKPDSLRSIAAELEIDVGSFVFVDDDPLECAAVREQLPEVPVVEVPRDADRIPISLKQAWELDIAGVTEADRDRARSYAANGRLRAERRRAPSPEEFLAGLEVRVSVSPMRREDVPRVVQLFQRTNQFNSTGLRVGERELGERLDSPGAAWVARVSDRLGDYGLVAAVLASTAAGTLRLEHLALSCRVFQREVEQTLLRRVVAAADPRPARVLIAYRDTGRNVPVRRFLDQLGAEEAETGDDGTRWFTAP